MTTKLEAIGAALVGFVPTGKTVVWIVATAATCIAAGFGLAIGIGDTAENVEKIPSIVTAVESNSARLTIVEARIEREAAETSASLQRIRCLAALSATGQVVDPLQIDDVCP